MADSTTPARPGAGTRIRRTLKAAAYAGPRRHRWQHPDRVLETLALQPGMRVADLGSGGGYFTFRLARAVGPEGRVYAVDTDADMRSLIADRAADRDLSNVVTVAATADDPRLPEPVDLAVIVDALHHLPDPPGYLRTLSTRLRDGGRMVVIEPVPRWWLFGHATDPETVRTTLEAAGLAIVGEHDFLPRQSFLIAAGTQD